MTSRDILIYLALQYQGDYERIVDAVHLKTFNRDPETDQRFQSLRCKTVTILDPDYPPAIADAIRPPFVLFYEGNLGLLQEPHRCITVVGSRHASDYAMEETRRLSAELASDGYIIISGLAQGIDTAAHEGAVKYGKTVAILGNGINRCFPSSNRDLQQRIRREGLLISEYPPDVHPEGKRFPARNRLLAACGQGVLCMSAKQRSGTMVTIAFALHYGKDVGCLPERSTEHNYCNEMIKEGAWLIETKQDVLDMIYRTPNYNPLKK